MTFEFPEEFILFDLEYTAWEGSQERKWSGPGEHREVIQIGAIRVGPDILEHDSFLEYVRPTVNPKLSEYIIGITAITQEDVDEKGLAYREAYEKFKTFVGTTPGFCWGKDIEVLEENNGLNDVNEILSRNQYHNARPLLHDAFAGIGIEIADYSSGTLLQAFGKVPPRRAHDAVNDMRNLLDALHLLRAAGK